MSRSRSLTAVAASALACTVVVAACTSSPASEDEPGKIATQASTSAPAEPAPEVRRVVAVSLDGLNPSAIRKLGPQGAPTLHRLIDEGAATLNARTERELSTTLPNHTGMVTGRRVAKDHHGHAVTWNDDRTEPRTVQQAAGHDVASVFSVVDTDEPERDTALFASKTKFSLFQRSWTEAIDLTEITSDNAALVRRVRTDLVENQRSFTFVHLSKPDEAGHGSGFMSPAYLEAVKVTDRLLGDLVATIDDHPGIKDHLVLIVTADHGGQGTDHSDATDIANYRVPFIVWGAGVAAGENLYALNRDYKPPGKRRTTYTAERQPVRNGDVANLVTELLELGPVPGSEHNARQNLEVS